METPKVGDKVDTFWGQWRVNAIVTKITRNGNIYAKRWNKSAKAWTTPKRIETYKGMYRRV